jgi:hypothetical protein
MAGENAAFTRATTHVAAVYGNAKASSYYSIGAPVIMVPGHSNEYLDNSLSLGWGKGKE